MLYSLQTLSHTHPYVEFWEGAKSRHFANEETKSEGLRNIGMPRSPRKYVAQSFDFRNCDLLKHAPLKISQLP